MHSLFSPQVPKRSSWAGDFLSPSVPLNIYQLINRGSSLRDATHFHLQIYFLSTQDFKDSTNKADEHPVTSITNRRESHHVLGPGGSTAPNHVWLYTGTTPSRNLQNKVRTSLVFLAATIAEDSEPSHPTSDRMCSQSLRGT